MVIRPVAEDIERLSQSLPACAPQTSANHLDPILPPEGIGGLHQCRPCQDDNSEQAKQARDPRLCKGCDPFPSYRHREGFFGGEDRGAELKGRKRRTGCEPAMRQSQDSCFLIVKLFSAPVPV